MPTEFFRQMGLGLAGAVLGTCLALTMRSVAGEVRMTTIINNPALPPVPGLPPADVDSNWQLFDPGQSRPIPIDIPGGSGDPNNYFVFIQFRELPLGVGERNHIHTIGGGGDEAGRLGAVWRLLTANSITVERFSGDTNADEIRVRVWDYGRAP